MPQYGAQVSACLDDKRGSERVRVSHIARGRPNSCRQGTKVTRPPVQTVNHRHDDGMTIIEVVIASAVLLFALTALLGLLAVSTGMTAKAKTQTVAVNRANSFIEQVRAADYLTLNQAQLNAIAASNAGTTGNVAVSVAASMTPFWIAGVPTSGPPSYIKVGVTVVATGVGAPFTYRTGTYLRQWKMAVDPGKIKPTVTFSSDTPQSGAVVFGDVSVRVGGQAHSNMIAVPLQRFGIYAAGTPVVETTLTAQDMTVDGIWDTTLWPDGSVPLTAEGRDATQLQVISRSVIIDNLPPTSTPSALSLDAVTSNAAATWGWGSVKDGVSPVDDYLMRVFMQNSAGTFDATSIIVNPSVKDGRIAQSVSTTALSRYYVAVRGRRPRETYSGYTGTDIGPEAASGYFISRPNFSGTITVNTPGTNPKGSKPGSVAQFTPSGFTYSTPTFARSAETVTWQYRYGTTTAWTNFTNGVQITAPAVGIISKVSVRCLVKLTPSGGSQIVVPSGIADYTGTSGTLVRSATVDWAKWPDTFTLDYPVWSNWNL